MSASLRNNIPWLFPDIMYLFLTKRAKYICRCSLWTLVWQPVLLTVTAWILNNRILKTKIAMKNKIPWLFVKFSDYPDHNWNYITILWPWKQSNFPTFFPRPWEPCYSRICDKKKASHSDCYNIIATTTLRDGLNLACKQFHQVKISHWIVLWHLQSPASSAMWL